jgi:hypothetical protein
MRLIEKLNRLYCGDERHMGAARILLPRGDPVFLVGNTENLLKSCYLSHLRLLLIVVQYSE